MKVEYRLLEEGDAIQEGDEVLNADCDTWDKEFYASKEADGRCYLGHEYHPDFHQPTRRRLTDAQDADHHDRRELPRGGA